jgi:hypothetical protein
VQEPWTPPWIRDGLAALISELEAAAPPGLGGMRTTFRQQRQIAKINALPLTMQRDNAIGRLLDQRVELVIAVKLVRAGVLARISRQTPELECREQGSEFGIEVTTRARREVGSEFHDLLEEGLFEEPDIEVNLERSDDRLLFSEDPAKTAAVADRVITAIKERGGRGGPGPRPAPLDGEALARQTCCSPFRHVALSAGRPYVKSLLWRMSG